MINFSIAIDLSALLEASAIARAGLFRTLAAAVERVTMAGAERWQEAVLKAPLWDGERRAYASSIHWRMTGDYSGEISSDYRYVEDIETGRPARDLKRMLDSSMKVRTTKDGRRYLIIPFRHNTPGNDALARDMPEHVYEQARMLTASRITSQKFSASGTGAFSIETRRRFLVTRNRYQWGTHLPRGLAPKLAPHHATDIYDGMKRFDTSTPKSASSTYLTFRVMMEGSSKWIVPAKPGLHIAQGVAEGLRPDAEKIFGAAIQRDLSML